MQDDLPLSDGALTKEQMDTETFSADSCKKRDGLFLAAALGCAGWYAFDHLRVFWFGAGYHPPGIGLTLTQWIIVILALFTAKREKRLRVTPGGVFLLLAALGLGACYGLYADDAMRLMNLPVTCLSTALSMFSLTGVTGPSPLTAAGLMAGCRRFFPAFVRHAGIPLRALKNRLTQKDDRLNGLGRGLLLGVLAAAVALGLLASADGVFQTLLDQTADWLGKMDASVVIRVFIALAGALFLFSFLVCTVHPGSERMTAPRRTANAVTYCTVLSMLAAVYALFVYVQFRYLFGGGDVAAVNGGYAAYARSGFFQLVLLAILTLALILPALILCPGSKPLRALCALVALLTGVIDYSAFFRMRLYIEAYGYTLLRVVTLWGVGMIALALIFVIVKSVRPGIRICPALIVLTLSTWLILNLSNPAAFIARRNLNASSTIRSVDLRYVISLSPDVLPEIDRIEDASLRSAAWTAARTLYAENQPAAYDWSLGWLRVESIPPDE